jgi:hypothetical protein
LQGERERAKDNWSLGKFTIDFEPAPRGVPRVGVQFEIDANGILHVLARDTKTGKEKIVEMKSAVDVDDSAVQRMVEESVEHAFDDLAARRWIEAKLKANETLAATKKALAELARMKLKRDYREKIKLAAREVEKVLAEENSGGFRRFEKAAKGVDRRSGRNHQAAGGIFDGQGDGDDVAAARADSVSRESPQFANRIFRLISHTHASSGAMASRADNSPVQLCGLQKSPAQHARDKSGGGIDAD